MNEIFLDTETTGLSVNDKHKIVEIACIETNDLLPTKKIFHKIILAKYDNILREGELRTLNDICIMI